MSPSLELLRRVTLLKGLDDDALMALAASFKPTSFAKDTLIVSQNDVGDALFVIETGRVKVVLYGDNGREMILAMLKAGDFFGEMSLLDGEPRSAHVIAVEESRLLVLKRDEFVRHLHARPAIALNILAELCQRLRRADSVIGNLALLDVYGRVARVLIDLAKREGQSTDEGILIRERPTQQDLASMIGTSRETVSRVLSEFQRRGYLSMQGKQLVLSHGFDEQHAIIAPDA